MIISDVVSGTYTARINEFVRIDTQEPVTILLPPSESGEPIEFRGVNSEEAVTFHAATGEHINGRPRLRHGAPGMWLRLMGVPATDVLPAGWLVAGFSTEVPNFE